MTRTHLTASDFSATLLAACCLTLALLFFFEPRPALAQQQTPAVESQASASDPEVERGVQLYRQNDMEGAVKVLSAAVKKSKDDPTAWLYLGQALMWRGEMREALKANQRALKLAPNLAAAHAARALLFALMDNRREAESSARHALQLDSRNLEAHYVRGVLYLRAGAWLKAIEEADAIIRLNDSYAPAYSLKAQALIGVYERGVNILSEKQRGAFDHSIQTVSEVRAAQPRWLKEAAESLEKYLQLAPQAQRAEELRAQIEALRFYATLSSADPNQEGRIYQASELTQKAVITFKPEPSYTEEARRALVTGTVRLRAVLASDGTVKHILVLNSLPHGLTERAVAAARKIKFTPARVNGMPVSQGVLIEYNFNVF
jgi:TonB family protein